MHIPSYFKNNCYTQDDWLIILLLTTEMSWKSDYGQQVARDLARGNHSTFHNFIIVLSLQMGQLQNCARTPYLEILFGIVFTKFMILFQSRNQQLLFTLWAFFLNGNLAYFCEFYIGQPTKVKPFRCPTSHYREGHWRCHPGVEVQRG
jgi:hypothetical protein